MKLCIILFEVMPAQLGLGRVTKLKLAQPGLLTEAIVPIVA